MRSRSGARPALPADLEAGRLAQVLANVIANAAEHGLGPVEVRTRRDGRLVTLELSPNAARPATAGGRDGRAGAGSSSRNAPRASWAAGCDEARSRDGSGPVPSSLAAASAGGVSATRRRGLLLLCFALVSGGLAASQVHEGERSTAARVGPLVPVAVAQRDLAADHRLGRGDMGVRRVPARFVPPDAPGPGARAAGRRAHRGGGPAGAYLTAGLIQGATARDSGTVCGRGSEPSS